VIGNASDDDDESASANRVGLRFGSSDPGTALRESAEGNLTMKGFTGNIESMAMSNTYFREVLFTSTHCQLVVMSLAPGEDIGSETHPTIDQFIRVESGRGKSVLAGVEHALSSGSAVVVPAGTEHNIINASTTEPMKLYTVYSPPNHPEGTIHKTKADAMAHEGASPR